MEISFREFDLQELELSPYAVDLAMLGKKGEPQTACSEENSPVLSLDSFSVSINKKSTSLRKSRNKNTVLEKTAELIYKFTHEHRLYEKIKLLTEIREALEAEIQNHQEKLIEEKVLEKYKVLDKDDFISCLAYCVVSCDDINFEGFGASIKYFHYILGTEFSEVLSKFACDSYLADLEAVFDYLLQWKEKKSKSSHRSLADIEIINYSRGNVKSIYSEDSEFPIK